MITETELRRLLDGADASIDPDRAAERRLHQLVVSLPEPRARGMRPGMWLAVAGVVAVIGVSAALPQVLGPRHDPAPKSTPAATAPISPPAGGPLADASPAPPAAVVVDIYNKTATPQLARNVGTRLKQLGFLVGAMANDDLCAAQQDCAAYSTTDLLYPPGLESAAKAVLLVYPYAAARPSTDVTVVTLRVGTDTELIPWPSLTA